MTRAVIGYDGSHGALHAVRATRTVLLPLKIEMHGAYVGEDGEAILDELEERLGASVERHNLAGDPHQAMMRLTEDVNANVLSLGFSGHSKLRDFAFGTLGEQALLTGRTAVLLAT